MCVLGEQVSAQLGPQWCPGSPWGSPLPTRQLCEMWQEVQHDLSLRFSRDVLKNTTVILCVFMCMHRYVFAYLCVVAHTCGGQKTTECMGTMHPVFWDKISPLQLAPGIPLYPVLQCKDNHTHVFTQGSGIRLRLHACVASTLLTDPSPHFHSNIYTEVWHNTFWSIALSVKWSSDAVTELFLQ